VTSGTKITIKQFGSTVGAVVTSVAACSTKCDSKGESLQIINVKGISGAVLQQSYIYSNSSFDIFQRAQPSKSGKEAQKAPIRKDFPEDASGIKPGDCFANSKFGDDSTILVVTETKQLKSMAKEGAWKDQLVVQLKVRADNPHTTIAEGATISTGDKNTIWLEAGELRHPSTSTDEDCIPIKETEVRDVRDDTENATTVVEKITPMTGYVVDMKVVRLRKFSDLWHFGNDSSLFTEGMEGRMEFLNSNITVWPSVETPTLKGSVPLHPYDPAYQKENDPREYIALSNEDVGDAYIGSPVALFTLAAASMGRPGSRSYKVVQVGDFMRTNDGTFVYVRSVLKPIGNKAGTSRKYADGNILVTGTCISEQTTADELPVMTNAAIPLNSLTRGSYDVFQVSKEIYLPESGLGGEKMREQLQGEVRTLYLDATFNGSIFKIETLINLNKQGKDLPLCCVKLPSTSTSKPVRETSSRSASKLVRVVRPKRKRTNEEPPGKKGHFSLEKKTGNANKKRGTEFARARNNDLDYEGNTVKVTPMRGNAESVQMERDLREAMHAKMMAELKLEVAESYHAKLLAAEAQKQTDTKAILERVIEIVDASRMRESELWEKSVKTVEAMSDKATTNMLKVQMTSHGSNAETNILMGTALQNNFLSPSSTDSTLGKQGEPQLRITSTEDATR